MTLPDFLWYFIVFSSLYIVEDVIPLIEMVSTHNFFANENFQTFVLRQENKVEQSTLLNVNCRLGLFLSSFKILLTKQFYFQTPGNKNYLYVSDSYYKVEPFN